MTDNAHLRLLADIRSAMVEDPVPGRAELATHLERRIGEIGDPALTEFAHVQRVACKTWGAERTAHFGQILREFRVSPKPPRKTAWARAEEALSHLPAPWRRPIADHIAVSRQGKRVKGRRLWSAAYAQSVISALRIWVDYCACNGLDLTPTGATLDAFGRHVLATATTGTAADYMDRILSGMALVQPGFASAACDFVAEDWRNRAQHEGPSTKTGAQLVGASAIYELGFRHIDEARARPMRGLHAARQFRNGLILALGTALPQRARALSCLAFDSTLVLLDAETLGVRIPVSMLKLPEDRKQGAPFERSFRNAPLAAALQEYRQSFRPIFDGGAALFPSVLSRNSAISETQIGRLTGNMTKATFGVRIPIHRLRDNVATEASESLSGGGLAATTLLDHKSQATVARHYDHSEGIRAAQEFGVLLASHQECTVDLDL